MNRQAANYVESVGDNKHYEWQTLKHNRWGFGISLFFFIVLLVTFWLFNRTSLETASISLKETAENNNIEQSTIYMAYSQVGDFNFAAKEGEVTYRMPKNWWQRICAPAKTAFFAINSYNQDSIYTLTTIKCRGI